MMNLMKDTTSHNGRRVPRGTSRRPPDQAEQNKLQIAYCPYIFLSKIRSVTYLNVTLRNLEETLNSIKHNNLRDQIQSLMEQNRIFGKPIRDMGIIEIKGRDNFLPLKPFEQKQINELRAVLFLAGVAKCNIEDGPNAGHDRLTSENFRILFQNFVLDDPYTGYASGKIVRVSDMGYKISQITYEKPPYAVENSFSCEESLLKSLEKMKRKNRKAYRLILRATDAVIHAYSNSEDVSHASRILEFSRAFEILFGLPERDQRKEFKNAIEKYCERTGERKRRYLSERPGGRVIETRSRQVMWADRFYVLRNHIIHGDNICDKAYFFYGQLHWDIALWFFLVSVKQIINESMGKKIFYDAVKCESGRFIYDNGLLRAATEKAVRTLLKMRHKKVV